MCFGRLSMVSYLFTINLVLLLFELILHLQINAFRIRKSIYPNKVLITKTKGLYSGKLFMRIGDDKSLEPTGIEIYSSIGCKYCRIAKAKLIELGVDFNNYDIHNTDNDTVELLSNTVKHSYIKERIDYARKHTVPQIYIQNEHIGGCTELLRDIEKGLFQEKLVQYNISILNNLGNSDVSDTKAKSLEGNRYTIIDGEPLNSIIYRDILSKDKYLMTEESNNRPSYTAIELSSILQRTALKLMDSFVNIDGKRINYKRMSNSNEFKEYLYLSTLLVDCSILELQEFSDVDKLIFYSNLYNAMIIHANCVLAVNKSLESTSSLSDLRSPEAIAQRTAFFSGKTGAIYQIGPYLFSPDDIEHGILRCNIPHPSQITTANQKQLPHPLSYFSASDTIENKVVADPRAILSITRDHFDPRIHFLLNCGALSCPPIKVLDLDNYQEAISIATYTYLMDEIKIQPSKTNINTSSTQPKRNYSNVIYLPRLLLWYANDFGSNIIYLLQTILTYLLPPPSGSSGTNSTSNNSINERSSSTYQQIHNILYNTNEDILIIIDEELQFKLLRTSNSNSISSDSITSRIIELRHPHNNNNSSSASSIDMEDYDNNIQSINIANTFKIEYNLYDWTFNNEN